MPTGCQHTKMRNKIIKRHNMASVLIVQALQKGPCGANQFAYTDIGSADKLSEQGLDLRNNANKTLPSWLLPNLTAHALKASSRPDAILFLPSIVCSSRVTTRNSIFQQLAKDDLIWIIIRLKTSHTNWMNTPSDMHLHS